MADYVLVSLVASIMSDLSHLMLVSSQRLTLKSKKMKVIMAVCNKYYNELVLYNQSTISMYTNGNYKLDTGFHKTIQFDLNWNGVIFIRIYTPNKDPISEP